MNPLDRYLVWLGGGTLAALALSWIAFQIQQQQFAPVVLFPLAVGLIFGGLLVLLNRVALVSSLALLIGCTGAWGLLLVVAQDYIGHQTRLAALDEQIAASHPLAAAMANQTDVRPTFGEHLVARVRSQPVWWPLDVLLIVATACGLVVVGTRARVQREQKHTEQQGHESV